MENGLIETVSNNLSNKQTYVRAQFIDRLYAYIVDNIFARRILVYVITGVLSFFIHSPGIDMHRILILITVIGYFAVYAYYNGGQTIAKKWNKLKVVDLEGSDISLSHFIIREFMARGIPLIGIAFVGDWALLWYLTYLLALRKNGLALHDIITRTQVIKLKTNYKNKYENEPKVEN